MQKYIFLLILWTCMSAQAGLLDLTDEIRKKNRENPNALVKIQDNSIDPYAILPESTTTDDRHEYIEKYCTEHNGRTYYPIQNGLRVDCLTNTAMWRIEYAPKWQTALTDAMLYDIYDNYMGDESEKIPAGVILIIWGKEDFIQKNKLKRIIEYYKLPIKVDSIEVYQ